MTKVNQKKLMKLAHAYARNSLKKVGDYVIALKFGMLKAWEQVKQFGRFTVVTETHYTIKAWFMRKNNIDAMECFHKEDILKETEKAYYVELGKTTAFGNESAWGKKVWVPKSCVEVSEFSYEKQ